MFLVHEFLFYFNQGARLFHDESEDPRTQLTIRAFEFRLAHMMRAHARGIRQSLLQENAIVHQSVIPFARIVFERAFFHRISESAFNDRQELFIVDLFAGFLSERRAALALLHRRRERPHLVPGWIMSARRL